MKKQKQGSSCTHTKQYESRWAHVPVHYLFGNGECSSVQCGYRKKSKVNLHVFIHWREGKVLKRYAALQKKCSLQLTLAAYFLLLM